MPGKIVNSQVDDDSDEVEVLRKKQSGSIEFEVKRRQRIFFWGKVS